MECQTGTAEITRIIEQFDNSIELLNFSKEIVIIKKKLFRKEKTI